MTRIEVSSYCLTMLEFTMAEVYYDLIKPMREKGRLLEIGTGFGESAKFFSDLKPMWNIYTCDAWGLYGDGRIYQQLEHAKVKAVFDYLHDQHNIIHIFGDSSRVPWELELDVLYLDGNHTYEGCKADYVNFSPHLKPGGLLIFDDYWQPDNLTNGVAAVVNEIEGYELLHTGIAAVMRKI